MRLKAYFIFCLFGLYACGGGSQDADTQAEAGDSIRTELATTATEKEKPEANVSVDREATARARIMGAVKLDDEAGYDSILNATATQIHYENFNRQWTKLEDSRLSRVRDWRQAELSDYQAEKHNLFYPFSGPDFLNAYEFFPNCRNYILFGLEPIGKLVDIQNMPPDYLASLRNALSEIFERNYFITSYMSGDLWGKGVLPIVNIFMARTGNQIVDIKQFYLKEDGSPAYFELEDAQTGQGKLTGLMIEFLNQDKSQSQKMFYFGTDVEDSKMQQKLELVKFIKSFENKITLIKSASYILHNSNFKIMRDLVLDETSMILQDDTGVRYTELQENGWSIKLYGKYARPVADFGSYTYQPALQKAYNESGEVQPLNFTYGYHWKTDNTSLMIATKKP